MLWGLAMSEMPKKNHDYNTGCEGLLYGKWNVFVKRLSVDRQGHTNVICSYNSRLKHKDSFGKSKVLWKIFLAEIWLFHPDYEGKSSGSNTLLYNCFFYF